MTSTCLITGASSGIGQQLALHYAAKGWTVYAVARSKDKLNEMAKKAGIVRIASICRMRAKSRGSI